MTTTPVHSITDEQIADIESYATSAIHSRENLGWYSSDDGCWWTGNADEGDFISSASPSAVRALITRLREAEKEAARYRWLRDRGDAYQWENILGFDLDDFMMEEDALDHAIDVYMQEHTK